MRMGALGVEKRRAWWCYGQMGRGGDNDDELNGGARAAGAVRGRVRNALQVVCLCACVCGCEVVWLRAYAGAGAYLVRLGVVKVVWAGQENARQEALAEAIGRGLVEGVLPWGQTK